MTEKKQPAELATVTEKQASLIKSVFKDNDRLLKVMRNLFFGFNLTEDEKTLIKNTFAKNIELRETVRRKTVPIFTDTFDIMLGGIADYWLDMEKDILGAHPDAIQQRVSSKQQVFEMVMQAMKLLENPDGKKVDLSYNPKLSISDPLQINLLARSLYIRTISQSIYTLKLIADMKEETPEQKAKRLEADDTR